ncbi:hypothetical protein TorRG33x02_065690 [Trema orientale]|uniref:Uncharacterized protein n=1 Tax=Trema orientale TaxID=63057 RepID=A0A2P5FIN6_TREOI|nr:hypothetical protein TorRG33x02_065690 [Trema orientale]
MDSPRPEVIECLLAQYAEKKAVKVKADRHFRKVADELIEKLKRENQYLKSIVAATDVLPQPKEKEVFLCHNCYSIKSRRCNYLEKLSGTGIFTCALGLRYEGSEAYCWGCDTKMGYKVKTDEDEDESESDGEKGRICLLLSYEGEEPY